MRRVGLAERLGKLTMELQEREEELEKSQHVFAPSQENPFLNNRESSSAKPVKQYSTVYSVHSRGDS